MYDPETSRNVIAMIRREQEKSFHDNLVKLMERLGRGEVKLPPPGPPPGPSPDQNGVKFRRRRRRRPMRGAA